MKKFILITAIISVFASCEKSKSKEEIIRENISNHIKKDMNDPESFEFVNMEPIDTVTKIIYYDRLISISKQSASALGKNSEREIDSLNHLKTIVSPDDIEFFTTTVKIRGNNSFGAKILTSYLVRLDTDLNVTYVKQRD